MQTVIYKKDTGDIVGVVNNVINIDGNNVVGVHESYGGIDLSICAFITIDDGTVTFNENGLSPSKIDSTWVDKSSLVVPSLQQYTILNPDKNTITDYQNAKIAVLNEQCNKAILSGFTSSVLGEPHQYDFDEEAQRNLNGALTMMAVDSTITTVTWKTVDSGPLPHTKDQFTQLCKDAYSFKEKMVQKYWTKKLQVGSCTTIDQVNSIVWDNTTPPSVPTGLTATPGSSNSGQVTLTWNKNNDVTMIGGGGYNIYNATTGVKLNTSGLITSTTTNITGLTSGTSYSFAVTAVDTDGNESAKSEVVIITAP